MLILSAVAIVAIVISAIVVVSIFVVVVAVQHLVSVTRQMLSTEIVMDGEAISIGTRQESEKLQLDAGSV